MGSAYHKGVPCPWESLESPLKLGKLDLGMFHIPTIPTVSILWVNIFEPYPDSFLPFFNGEDLKDS